MMLVEQKGGLQKVDREYYDVKSEFYKKIGLGPVEVLNSMETKSKEHTKEMLKTLKQQGFTYRLIE